jgi:hypothetical protein
MKECRSVDIQNSYFEGVSLENKAGGLLIMHLIFKFSRCDFDFTSACFNMLSFDKIFSGNKPCQLWIKAQHFRDHLHLHHHGNYVDVPDDGDGL